MAPFHGKAHGLLGRLSEFSPRHRARWARSNGSVARILDIRLHDHATVIGKRDIAATTNVLAHTPARNDRHSWRAMGSQGLPSP
jgi:hypothetical protein